MLSKILSGDRNNSQAATDGVFVLSTWADEHKSPCHALKQLYSHCILDINEFDFCSSVILAHCVNYYI